MDEITYSEIEIHTSVESLLFECGASQISDKGDYISFSSPFHEDKNPSMVLYKDTLMCIDFSYDYKKHLNSFVYDTLEISLWKFLGVSRSERLENIYFKSKTEKKRYQNFDNDTYHLFVKGGKIEYDLFEQEDIREYVESRFIDREFAEEFKIGYTRGSFIYRTSSSNPNKHSLKGTPFFNRLCIPIIEKGEIFSLEGRDITKQSERKCIYPKGCRTSTLFNIDNLSKEDPLILVEGIMDIPRVWKFITKNITTVFGIQLTYRQKELLLEFEDVILLPDKDGGGEQFIKIFDKFYDKKYRIAELPFGDPGDSGLSIREIEDSIVNSKDSIEYFLEKSELISKTELDSHYFSF